MASVGDGLTVRNMRFGSEQFENRSTRFIKSDSYPEIEFSFDATNASPFVSCCVVFPPSSILLIALILFPLSRCVFFALGRPPVREADCQTGATDAGVKAPKKKNNFRTRFITRTKKSNYQK